MNYAFPYIRNISDILPVIKDRKEFVVAQKEGGYSVINYVVAMEDTFPPVETVEDAILRECRGLIFNTHTGEILSRRYHKFFNVGERMETSPQFVDLKQPHIVLEKMDGSMITPFVTPEDGKIRWGTKMGVTDVAAPVEEFVDSHPEYYEFANYCLDIGFTPIFEWCSRKQKIVIDYPQDTLMLTAIRHTTSGEYLSYKTMVVAARDTIPAIPVVKALEIDEKDTIRDVMEVVREWKTSEGVVVRFDNGHMVKVKAEQYLQLHKAKDVTKFEKNVLEIILQDKLDDLLPLLEEPYKSMVQDYQRRVFDGIAARSMEVDAIFRRIMFNMKSTEKREFAVHHVKLEPKEYHSFLYGMWSGEDAEDMIKEALLKSCSSQNRLDNNRWMMYNVTYDLPESENVLDEV